MERTRLASHHHRTVIAGPRPLSPRFAPRNRARRRSRPTVAGCQLLPSLIRTLICAFAALSSIGSKAGQLEHAVRAFTGSAPFLHASWGVDVRDAGSGEVHCDLHRDQRLKPASNAKLFTAALALTTLGPDHRFHTELIPTGPISRRGLLKGHLIVRGCGDFSFAQRFATHPSHLSLQPILHALRTAGLRGIQGDIVANGSTFTGASWGHGWTRDDLEASYAPEINALVLDDNIVTWTLTPGSRAGDAVRLEGDSTAGFLHLDDRALKTGPSNSTPHLRVTRDPGSRTIVLAGSLPAGSPPRRETFPVPNAPLHFVHRLRGELRTDGIKVRGVARLIDSSADAPRSPDQGRAPLPISVPSPPVRELVAAMMKPSQNLYAQILLFQAGASIRLKHPHLTSEEAGVLALRSFLDAARIPSNEVLLDEGSGLSRSSLVTPSAIVDLLRFMDQHPDRDPFLASLPVAGVDGTLRERFLGTPLAGNVRAKTGTLQYVTALSGFMTNNAGRRLAFSIMLNAYQPPIEGPSGRDAVDHVARLIFQEPP